MLCALMYRQNGDLANLLKSARKKSAPECPFECGGGGGGNRYLGNAQIEVTLISKVLPLGIPIKNVCHCRLNVFGTDIVSLAVATSA